MSARIASLLVALMITCPVLAQDQVKPVKVITVSEVQSGLVRQFFGQVVARQTVDIAFQVSGQIVKFPVIEGEPVAEGALIAELDLEPFELALDQARLQKEQADRNVARLEQLSSSAVSQVSVDDATTLAGLAQISVRNAEYSLEHATLTAPFDALVATRNVANFTTISAGTPIVRLHDMSELRIEIDVPEILFQRAGEDPDVEITAQFPSKDTIYPLEVREFNAETSAVGQTFRLTFGLTPPDDLRVLPGSSVTVTAKLNGGPGAIRVPTSAVKIGADGSTTAMIFEEDGSGARLREAQVEVTPDQDGGVLVTSGLSVGDEIVATGVNGLTDGQTVRRFTGFSN